MTRKEQLQEIAKRLSEMYDTIYDIETDLWDITEEYVGSDNYDFIKTIYNNLEFLSDNIVEEIEKE